MAAAIAEAEEKKKVRPKKKATASKVKKTLVVVESPAKAKTIEKYLEAYRMLTGKEL